MNEILKSFLSNQCEELEIKMTKTSKERFSMAIIAKLEKQDLKPIIISGSISDLESVDVEQIIAKQLTTIDVALSGFHVNSDDFLQSIKESLKKEKTEKPKKETTTKKPVTKDLEPDELPKKAQESLEEKADNVVTAVKQKKLSSKEIAEKGNEMIAKKQYREALDFLKQHDDNSAVVGKAIAMAEKWIKSIDSLDQKSDNITITKGQGGKVFVATKTEEVEEVEAEDVTEEGFGDEDGSEGFGDEDGSEGFGDESPFSDAVAKHRSAIIDDDEDF